MYIRLHYYKRADIEIILTVMIVIITTTITIVIYVIVISIVMYTMSHVILIAIDSSSQTFRCCPGGVGDWFGACQRHGQGGRRSSRHQIDG